MIESIILLKFSGKAEKKRIRFYSPTCVILPRAYTNLTGNETTRR